MKAKVKSKDRGVKKVFCQLIKGKPHINKQGMDDTDGEDLNMRYNQLTEENRQLKESLETLKQKCDMYEEEVKTLLRKIVKLLEEKIERLEQDLTFLQN